jgi:hypothetical protein
MGYKRKGSEIAKAMSHGPLRIERRQAYVASTRMPHNIRMHLTGYSGLRPLSAPQVMRCVMRQSDKPIREPRAGEGFAHAELPVSQEMIAMR